MSSSMLRTCVQLQRVRETEVEKKRGHRKAGRAIARVLSSWLVEFQPIERPDGVTETFFYMGPDDTDQGSTFENASSVHVLARAVHAYDATHVLKGEEKTLTSLLKWFPVGWSRMCSGILMMKPSNNDPPRAFIADNPWGKTFPVHPDIFDFLIHHEDDTETTQDGSAPARKPPKAICPVSKRMIEEFRKATALEDELESLWLAVSDSLNDKNKNADKFLERLRDEARAPPAPRKHTYFGDFSSSKYEKSKLVRKLEDYIVPDIMDLSVPPWVMAAKGFLRLDPLESLRDSPQPNMIALARG